MEPLPSNFLGDSLDWDLAAFKRRIEELRIDPRSSRDEDGRILLHCMAFTGHLDAVKYLVEERNCDAMRKDKYGNTPLTLAALAGKLDIVQYLTGERGCDPMCRGLYERTPLHCACNKGHLDVVKYLIIDQKVDPSCRDEDESTPLHLAQFGTLEVTRYLIEEKGCDVFCRDKDGNTPLHVAAVVGKLSTLQYLISEQGCDPMCRGQCGRTILHLACQSGHVEVVKYLIDNQKMDPLCQDEDGYTSLYVAAGFGTLEVVKYLIEEKGCDATCIHEDGNTLLYVAAVGGKLDTMQYLISEWGHDPMCRAECNRTPLHGACNGGHLDIVQYLIDDHKVDPSCSDEDDSTPLHIACGTGQLSVVKALIEDYLCDPGLRDCDGETPLDYANVFDQPHIVAYLSSIQAIVSTDLRRALVARLKPYIRKAHQTGKELGRGTYGSVIELVSAGEIVAGKVFKTMSSDRMEAVKDKICGEIIVMMQIYHPNIVKSRGVCFLVDHPMPVLLMERLMSSLHAYLLDPSHQVMEFTSKISILCDVASGMFYLHSYTPAIIHRDMTAKNILLDSNLKAKIGDFGNARLMDLDPECSPETFTSLPGTLEYMPPEAVGKHTKYDTSLDVFSFGQLALFTIIQMYVDLLPASYSDSEEDHLRSEVKRREKSIGIAEKILGAKHSVMILIKSCLHNYPAQRPHAEQILSRLQQVTSVAEAPEPKRMFEEDCVSNIQQVDSDARGSELSNLQLASSSQESDPTPLTPPADEYMSSSGHPLDTKPTIKQLLVLKTKSGTNLDIQTALAAEWKTFGYFLDFDDDGEELELIEKECGIKDPVTCYQQMMRKWMSGSGVQPATWRTLVKLLREWEHGVLAKDIEDAVTHA